MGVREALQKRTGAVVAVTILVIALAWAFIGYQWSTRNSIGQVKQALWYSDDDGKTYFADDAQKDPPFDHNGKPAYRAYVFTCDGKTNFVGCLGRFAPEAKKKMDALRLKHKNGRIPFDELMNVGGQEAKAPGTGDKGWVGPRDPKAMQLMHPKCPDGKPATAVPAPDVQD